MYFEKGITPFLKYMRHPKDDNAKSTKNLTGTNGSAGDKPIADAICCAGQRAFSQPPPRTKNIATRVHLVTSRLACGSVAISLLPMKRSWQQKCFSFVIVSLNSFSARENSDRKRFISSVSIPAACQSPWQKPFNILFSPGSGGVFSKTPRKLVMKSNNSSRFTVLSTKSADIIKSRYGLPPYRGKEQSIIAISKIYEVTRGRIYQLEQTALKKLTCHLEPELL